MPVLAIYRGIQSTTIWLHFGQHSGNPIYTRHVHIIASPAKHHSFGHAPNRTGENNMDKTKFDTKANEILIWLDANDAGSLGPVIEATIQAGLAETDETALDRYWNSIRSLCGNLGEKNPVRRGTPSKHSPEALANVDSVESRLMNAFATIGEADLILDIYHPRQNDNHQGHYDSIQSWAKAMAASGRRYMMEALNSSRWDGSMTDNLTNMALKEPKLSKEVPSEE